MAQVAQVTQVTQLTQVTKTYINASRATCAN